MALESGTHLGHYEIAEQIGKGGMGEVYRARDTKLGREVAIKVLPAEFSQDADRLARLDREARMLAALNHPNIAAIHGLEESGSTRFLVLELVEGDTLADRLKQRALPLEESLTLAIQIAEALEAAHAKGVVHRDLKPANIKITPEGRVKVLDFGLAKVFMGEHPDVDPSASPTLSMAATRAGVVLGTAAYMAPEQASGDVADHRADIWAFGVVLFEMLSGKTLFSGKTVTHILASVMKEEPDWNALPANLHPRIRFLLERCLEKEPDDRCPTIAEARTELRKASAEAARVETTVPRTEVRAAVSRNTVLVGVAAVLLASFVTGLAVWNWRPVEPARVQRFDYALPDSQAYRNLGRNVIAVAPDGSRFAYNSSDGLFLRSMDAFDARVIPGTEGSVAAPFFSPDSQTVGFFDTTTGELKRIAVQGGTSVRIAAAEIPFGVSWAEDGTILYGQADGIWRVPATGGEPARVIEAGPGEFFDGPQLLPDGDHVLFTVTTLIGTPDRWDQGRIVVQSISTGDRTEIWEGGSDARYLPTGHIVYALGAGLYGLRFDPDSMETSGGPVPLVDGVQRAVAPILNTASANYGVTDSGDLVYLEGLFDVGTAGTEVTSLVWQDRDGREEPLTIGANTYIGGRVSPDGGRAVLVIGDEDGATDLWVLDLSTQSLRQLTFNGGVFPVWLDNETILFQGTSDFGVYSVSAEGGAPDLLGGSDEFASLPWSLTPDGETLAVAAMRSASDIVMGLLQLDDGTFEVLPVANTMVTNEPALSPDGAWIAFFESPLDGTATLNIRPFPDIERARYQVPRDFARHPVWSRDGSELFFFSENGVWSLPVFYEPSFGFGTPEPVFSGNYRWGYVLANGAGGRAWDYDPVSDRFLVVKIGDATQDDDDAGTPRIRIVLNWFEEVRERVSGR